MREYTITVNEAELNIIGTGIGQFSKATTETIDNLIGKLRSQAQVQEAQWAADAEEKAKQEQFNLEAKSPADDSSNQV